MMGLGTLRVWRMKVDLECIAEMTKHGEGVHGGWRQYMGTESVTESRPKDMGTILSGPHRRNWIRHQDNRQIHGVSSIFIFVYIFAQTLQYACEEKIYTECH